MDRRGFTLVELLATLVVLGIVVGFAVYSIMINMKDATSKTEDVFIGTIEDAIEVYLNSPDVNEIPSNSNLKWKKLNFKLNKSHGEVDFYRLSNKTTGSEKGIPFRDIINSSFSPLNAQDVVNPNNDSTNDCNLDTEVKLFRDDDYIYYYLMDKSTFRCFTNKSNWKKGLKDSIDKYITNLPCDYLKSRGYVALEGNRCYTG